MAGIFLKFEGGPKIEGSATTKGFEKQLVAQSFSLGANNSVDATADAVGRVRSMVSVSEFTISRNMTNASPVLFGAVAAGTEFPKVTVSMTIQDEKAPQWHTQIVFENVYCNSISWSASDMGEIYESDSFAYGKLTVNHKEFVNGKPVGPTSASWNLKTNTPD